jgi:hypothetical protein
MSDNMRRRILNNVISIIFLFGFLNSQVIIFVHTHSFPLVTKHQSKETKQSYLTEKCSICDLQSQNNLLFHTSDIQSFTITISTPHYFYIQTYSGIKLIKSSSRSPPLV